VTDDEDDHSFVIVLTPSQRMALIDIITAVIHPPLQMRVYVDFLRDVVTTPSELVDLVTHASPIRADDLLDEQAIELLDVFERLTPEVRAATLGLVRRAAHARPREGRRRPH